VLLLQLGEPRIAAGLLAAAFVFDEAAAGENQREILRDLVLHVLLLDRLIERGQPPERLLVVVRRILGDEVRAWRIQRLAVLRDAVGKVPHDRPRLGVAEGMAAVLQRYPLDAAGKIGLPVLALGGFLL